MALQIEVWAVDLKLVCHVTNIWSKADGNNS